jgi:hypothetical protein
MGDWTKIKMKLISFFKSPIIEFLCEEKDFGVIPEPVSAFKMIPDWFKSIKNNTPNRDQFGGKGMTAKKCIPMLDAMSIGFIIPLWGDVNVRTNAANTLIEVSSNPLGPIIGFHGPEQLGGGNNIVTGKQPAVKFINRWIVKTAPGYSTLFVPAINHIEKRFTLLSGLVDTDTYPKVVNFPGSWNIGGFDDILPAGTPLVSCIPIRRKDMVRESIPRLMTREEVAQRCVY